MKLTAKVDGDPKKIVDAASNKIKIALTETFREAATRAQTAVRATVSAAGFGGRFTSSFNAKAYPKPPATSLDPAMVVSSKISYADIFQKGGDISGHELLWIPTKNVPTGRAGRRITPSQYVKNIGPLKFELRGGVPLLVKPKEKKRRRKGQAASVSAAEGEDPNVMFFGVHNVHIEAKFDINPPTQKVVDEMADIFRRKLAEV